MSVAPRLIITHSDSFIICDIDGAHLLGKLAPELLCPVHIEECTLCNYEAFGKVLIV
jgi:hypothetical protein